MRNSYDKKDPKIYQTERGKWRVRYFDDMADKYRSKVFKTKTDAENLKRALSCGENLDQWLTDEIKPREQLKTFEDLAAKWMDHGRNVRRISESCLINYRCHLSRHIFPVMGKIPIWRLRLDHIELLSKELITKKPVTRSYLAVRKNRIDSEDDSRYLTINYQREILTVACMITTWASGRKPKLLQENPFESFKLPKAPEHLYDYWSLDDEDQFFEWIENGGFYEKETTRYHHHGAKKKVIELQIRSREVLRDIVMIALRTGMRLGEIGALRNADVDLSGGFVIVRGSYSRKEGIRKNTTKSKKARRIEINDDVREILRRRRHTPQMEPLFNIQINCIKFFSRTCRWAGVKEIHFHSLRHTCLTNLANGYGMDKPLPLPKVQQIAGHSDIKTTMRYVHVDVIQDTASLQWSRVDRLSKKEPTFEDEAPVVSFKSEDPKRQIAKAPKVEQQKRLRLISSSKNS